MSKGEVYPFLDVNSTYLTGKVSAATFDGGSLASGSDGATE